MFCELKKSFENMTATIGIIGLGYVGLPLALEFSKRGFPVIGLDTDVRKVEKLARGETYIKHIPSEQIADVLQNSTFSATTDFTKTAELNAIIICVPTPLTKNREPDMSHIIATCEKILPYMKKGQMVILESTTYPGTCEDVIAPILTRNGFKLNEDFCVAYSPEREDPNNPDYTTSTIPKVVGCNSSEGLEAAKMLYDQVVVKTVPVSSTKVAEATKLMENIFRSVNIALVNELKIVFNEMDIDIYEVINAAATKPFGFMPFYPGPGLGGHCIPVDPFYLTWKSREYDHYTKFIELAGEINTGMPRYVVNRVHTALNDQEKPLKGSHILIMGLAYKSDIDDLRESPSLKLIELLENQGAKVDYHDDYIKEIPNTREHKSLAGRKSVPLESCSNYDCVLVATAHSYVDYENVAKNSRCVVDTRNVVPRLDNVYWA